MSKSHRRRRKCSCSRPFSLLDVRFGHRTVDDAGAAFEHEAPHDCRHDRGNGPRQQYRLLRHRTLHRSGRRAAPTPAKILAWSFWSGFGPGVVGNDNLVAPPDLDHFAATAGIARSDLPVVLAAMPRSLTWRVGPASTAYAGSSSPTSVGQRSAPSTLAIGCCTGRFGRDFPSALTGSIHGRQSQLSHTGWVAKTYLESQR